MFKNILQNLNAHGGDNGAKYLNPISIGDNVAVRINAVAVRDGPDNYIATGVHAVINPRRI